MTTYNTHKQSDNWRATGQRIKRQRERQHLSRQEVADLAGLSRQTIVNLEGDGGRRVPAEKLDEVLKALGMQITLGAKT